MIGSVGGAGESLSLTQASPSRGGGEVNRFDVFKYARSALSLLWICLVVVCTPTRGVAGELRIVDETGLTRAYSPLKGAARLEVTLIQGESIRAIHPATLRLRNVDGFSDELVAVGGSGGIYVFQPVRNGVWEVSVADEDVKLKSVKIVKRQSELADMKEIQ